VAVAIAACGFDLRTRRIPNALTFGAAAAALLSAGLMEGPTGIGLALAGCFLGLILWLPIYALGGMGAGDVKLIAAIGAWLGPSGVLFTAIYAGIAGAVMALLVALARGYLREAYQNVQMLVLHWCVAGLSPQRQLTLDTARGPRLAYAVPILVGTLLAVWAR
jgi:prepilin peptidase CpaA